MASAIAYANVGDNAQKSGLSVIVNPQTSITIFGWVFLTALNTNRILGGVFGTGNNGQISFNLTGTAGDVLAFINGATSEQVTSNNQPLAVLNKWYFVCCTLAFGVGAHIYIGDAQNAPVEPTYSVNTRGIGQVPQVAPQNGIIGNRTALDRALQGSAGGAWGMVNTALTQAQITYLWRYPAYFNQLAGQIGFWLPGYEPGGFSQDYSGNTNTLTFTGVTYGVGPGIPLAPCLLAA